MTTTREVMPLGSDDEEKKKEVQDRLREEVLKHEDRVLKLEATVFQLANYNFVFQGVILSAVISGSSTLTYHFVWFPFTLSLIATLINLATLIRIAARYTEYLEKLDDKIYMCYKNTNGQGDVALHEKNTEKRKKRKIAFCLSMTSFVAFSLVMATATAVIPCFRHKNGVN